MMVPDVVSIFCPHCGKHTAVTPAPLSVITRSSASINGIAEMPLRATIDQAPYYSHSSHGWWLGKCNACSMPVLVRDHGSLVFPSPQPAPVAEAIPEPMRTDLREAKTCLAVGAYNAAVVMARRALQAAAVEQGAPKGKKLWEQIKHLADVHLITARQKDLADAARWVGNHGAHDTEPDLNNGVVGITDVTEDDASDTLIMVEHFFEALYVTPKLAREQLAKRNKTSPVK